MTNGQLSLATSLFNSEEERNEILSRSTDPLLIFGNDADLLYSSRGIDPRVQTNDMSSDPDKLLH